MENEGISQSKHANIKSSINRSVYCGSMNRIIRVKSSAACYFGCS